MGGSNKIQTLSRDSSSIKIEDYSNGKGLRLLKLVYFTYKGADILQTSIYTLPSGFFGHTHHKGHVIL